MGISERGVYSSPVLTEVVTRCCIQLEATRPIPGGNNVFCPTPLKCWEYQCPFSISFIIQGINKSVVHSNPLLWSTTIDWKYWHSSLPFVVVVMLVKQWQCWQLHCKITYYWWESLHLNWNNMVVGVEDLENEQNVYSWYHVCVALSWLTSKPLSLLEDKSRPAHTLHPYDIQHGSCMPYGLYNPSGSVLYMPYSTDCMLYLYNIHVC